MPQVKQYDWSKLKPAILETHQPRGTQNFSTYEYKEQHKRSKHGAVKITRKPKIQLQDKDLVRDSHDNMLHLRSITQEE